MLLMELPDIKQTAAKSTTAIVLFLALLIFLFFLFIYQQNKEQTYEAEIALYQRFLAVEAESLNYHFRHLQGITRMMAQNNIIRQILCPELENSKTAGSPGLHVRTINSNLGRIAEIADISAAYIMDINGRCVLSSNSNFIGKNYLLRPYFKQAVTQGSGLYAAQGVTSKKTGIYYSEAIKIDGRNIGVATLKFSPTFFHVAPLPSFRESSSGKNGEIVALALSDGIVIRPYSSSLYCVAPLSDEQKTIIASSRQFPLDSIVDMEFSSKTWKQLKETGFSPAVKKSTLEKYFTFMTPLLDQDLYLLHIIPIDKFNEDYTPLGQSQILVLNILYLLTAILLAAIITLAVHHRKFRQISTELLEEQQEHTQAMGLYQSIIDGAPIGFWQIDPNDRTIKMVNTAFCKMVQMPEKDIVGRPVADFFTDTAYADLKKNIPGRCEMDRLIFQSQIRGRQDDSVISVIINSQLIYSPITGNKQRFAFITDISLNIKQEEKLNLMLSALEQSAGAIVVTDNKGTIEYVNQAMINISGYSRQECLGTNPKVLKSGTHGPEFYEEMWAVLLAGKTWKGRIHNKNKAGGFYWEEAVVSPVLNKEGEITHFIAIKTDISRQIKMEKQLREALEKANSANKAKSKFLANMSHEIRTPMNAIIGMSRLALDSGLRGRDYQLIATIHLAANNLLELLNDILDFSKIEAGQLEIAPQPFSLFDFVNSIKKTMDGLAQDKKINLVIDADREKLPEFIKADELRLRQVVINLINNAIKFTSHGTVTFKLGSEESETDKILLSFAVIDTGIGIEDDKQEKIFANFSQADSSTSREYGGTGLGLSISRQLVEMMGGEIKLKSKIGKGSTFSFVLAVPVVPLVDMKKQQEEENVIVRYLRILVVDDNSMNLELARMILEQYDHCVSLAENAIQALELIADNNFDLIFMDVQMPGMDGLTATRVIRRIEQGKAVDKDIDANLGERLKNGLSDTHQFIVAMTANAIKGDKEQCLAAGMDYYLTKPFSPKDIIQAINHLGLTDGTCRAGKEQTDSTYSSPEKNTRRQVVDYLKSANMLDEEQIEEIMAKAAKSLKENFSWLAEAVESENHDEIHKAAHKLKGSLLNLGLNGPAAMAAEIEKAGRNKEKIFRPEKIKIFRGELEWLF